MKQNFDKFTVNNKTYTGYFKNNKPILYWKISVPYNKITKHMYFIV